MRKKIWFLFPIFILVLSTIDPTKAVSDAITNAYAICEAQRTNLDMLDCIACLDRCHCLCLGGRYQEITGVSGLCRGGGLHSCQNAAAQQAFSDACFAAFNYNASSSCQCRSATRPSCPSAERLPPGPGPDNTDTTSSTCPWYDDLLNNCVQDRIVVNTPAEALADLGIDGESLTAETSSIRREDVQRFEERVISNGAADPDTATTYTRVGTTALEDTTGGDAMRSFLDLPDPYTYEEPRTRAFFERIDQLQGTSECDLMGQIYEAVTGAVPGYGAFEGDPLEHYCTFEQALMYEAGICREKSMLLATALERRGFEADFVPSNTHVWVRVDFQDRQIDLDPTFYQSFIPLRARTATPDPNYCR